MNERDRIGMDEPELDDLALEALAEAHAVTPPAALRQRLLADARRHAAGASRAGGAHTAVARRWRVVGTVAAGVALALGGLLALEHGRLGRERDRVAGIARQLEEQQTRLAQRETQLGALAQEKAQLEARLDEQARTLVGLRETVESQTQLLKVLSGPRTIVANLAPKGDVTAVARVLVDPASGEAALAVADLPPLDEGRTYELWAIRGPRAPEPAGLFRPGADRAATVRMPRVADAHEITAFAVSIEPANGSQSPTGPIVLIGAVTAS